MHPAPSVILFTVLSGIGFGLLACLGLGWPAPEGWFAFVHWGLGYGLAVGGLLASTFHLGNPQRFLLAFTQWRSSWLSREALASVATLTLLAPVALSDWLGLGWPREIGLVGALGAALTIMTTAMIYAQMRTIPRWNHWTTPALFFGFAVTGGVMLAGQGRLAGWLCLILAALLIIGFRIGDTRFGARGQTMATATGLGKIGAVRVFEQPHTGENYLMREMIYIVARKHAQKLRVIAVALAAVLPAVMLLAFPTGPLVLSAAVACHLTGALAARWLFFAEAEHVVGLFYGQR